MAFDKVKYVVLVGDGMGDYPLVELNGKTPLEAADTPNMDEIAGCGIGLVKTIPEGMPPGSDVANLSLLGYDPRKYHTGRAPLEAVSMGVPLAKDDIAFRMNLVTLDQRSPYEIIMVSHSAGDISTQEGKEIIDTLKDSIQRDGVRIYPGVAYRHLLVWKSGPLGISTIAPHDVLGQNMAGYLATGNKDPIVDLIRRSWDVLRDHPVNVRRRRAGLKEANSIWPWGQGREPRLPQFHKKYGLRGGVISAVDLVRGIGKSAGLRPIHVEGATGYLDTNYKGKAEAALEWLKEMDFMFLHVEAPDEASHAGNIQEKIQAIEAFDKQVVGTMLKGLGQFERFRIMVASDHFTPIAKRTHTDDPTLFAWASGEELSRSGRGKFSEKRALESGLYLENATDLMATFIQSI